MITVGFRVVRLEDNGRAENLSRIYAARSAAEDFLQLFQRTYPAAKAIVVDVQRETDGIT